MQVYEQSSFFEIAKSKIASFFSTTDISSGDIIRLVTSFGVGFLCGLALKRYCKFIILFLIGVVLLLTLLEYGNLITVHVAYFKSMIGLNGVETVESLITTVIDIMKIYIIESGSALLGCIIGFKVG